MFISTVKRAEFWPSFFLVLAFIIVIPTSTFTGWIIWWSGAACLVLLFLRKPDNPFPLTPLSFAFLAFVAILGTSYYLISPAYHGEVIFYLLFFTLPFIIFSSVDIKVIKNFFGGGTFIFALLVVWGLIQHFTGLGFIVKYEMRANAIFYTPNTFATGINLFLLSLVAIYLSGKHTKIVYPLTMFFFAGLLATQSRGGYLGLLAGLCFLIFYMGVRQFRFRWLKVIFGFAVVFMLFQLSPNWNADNLKATFLHGHTAFRLELYTICWDIIKTNPFLGYGYFNYGYLFQRYKIEPFLDSNALFVHNDYLQIWAEAGIFGLISILALILIFYLTVLKHKKSAYNSDNLIWTYACCASITSIFAHAVVDFPLYVPAFQFLLGAYIGTLNGISRNSVVSLSFPADFFKNLSQRINIRANVFKILITIIFLVWLFQSVIAEHVSIKGTDSLKKQDIKTAIKQYVLAQKLVPGNAYYYWSEGVIWNNQAIEMKNSDLIDIADDVFAKGMSVNPYYPNNFLSRIKLHRDYRDLLAKPADNKTISEWISHVYMWNPHLRIVKLEYAKTLAFLGDKQKAADIAKDLQKDNPDSKMVKKLIEDFRKNKIL